jgi:NADH-quinone oxidoreductase subunit N
MWLPDVYEGAPTVITGFMVSGAKAAAFIVLIRVFMLLGGGKWLDAIWWCALLTMILGNFAALAQTNLKRMLGYSSIAHTGYLLVGFVSAPGASIGYGPVVMYLVIYAVMNLGAFILLAAIGSRDDTGLNLHDLAGFSRRRPWVAFAFAVFLLSMAGLPPTAGFAAKFTLFYSAVQAGQVPLVVLGILCSAVSIYYYLRVLVWMYMRDPVGETVKSRISVWAAGAIIMMVLLVLYFGVNPEPLVSAAKGALAGI